VETGGLVGHTVLHTASSHYNYEGSQFLPERRKGRVETGGLVGHTVLHTASSHYNYEGSQFLQREGRGEWRLGAWSYCLTYSFLSL
jgi:hypothetical protein